MNNLFPVNHDFLRFPIQANGKQREVHLYLNEREIFRFGAALWDGKEASCDFYAELPVKMYKGNTIRMVIDPAEDGSEIECMPEQTDEMLQRDVQRYPYIHFAPTGGWMNDPNGLCYYNGEYHLFFQHNMFDLIWNDISWGHAVSKDMIHWTQVEEALMPDKDGACFSGCAIGNGGKDRTAMPGCPEDALLLFYTCAGGRTSWSKEKKFTQKAAWSTDGRTFTRMDQPVLENIVYENRDPKIYWNEECGHYYMVLFLDGHDYGIFVSKDMSSWKRTQTITIEESWECPDLIKIPVRGSEEEKWIFWTPDSYYLVGTFDGQTFEAQQKIRKIYGVQPKLAYAAQTFWGIENRIVQLPWIFAKKKNPLYCGIMGIPRELELITQGQDYILAEHPIEEVEKQMQILWKSDEERSKIPGRIYIDEMFWEEEGAAILKLCNRHKESFSVKIADVSVSWDRDTGELKAGDLQTVVCEEITDMTLIADRGILEIGMNQDTTLFYIEIEQDFSKTFRINGNMECLLGILN